MAEQEPKKVIVRIGEEFPAFSSEPRQLYLDPGLVPQTLIPVDISINLDPIDRIDDEDDITEAMFPLEPKKGYRITTEDLDQTTRKQKLKQLRDIAVGTKGYGWIFAAVDMEESKRLGLTDKDEEFQPAVTNVLDRLIFYLTFPNGSAFEGDKIVYGEELWWGSFYPLDTGPLPGYPRSLTLYINENMDPGLMVQIRAKFILDPNPKMEPPEPYITPTEDLGSDPEIRLLRSLGL